MKEFLVSKLKETEAALKRSLDEKGLSLRQSASDQEVISFLDSRTQVRACSASACALRDKIRLFAQCKTTISAQNFFGVFRSSIAFQESLSALLSSYSLSYRPSCSMN